MIKEVKVGTKEEIIPEDWHLSTQLNQQMRDLSHEIAWLIAKPCTKLQDILISNQPIEQC
jgi:hypothetical protein